MKLWMWLVLLMLTVSCATVKKAAVIGWTAVEVVDILTDDEPEETEE